MLIPLLAAALVVATPAPAPKLDPVKDQPAVCLAAFIDKLQNARAGDPPVSLIVPLYTDAAKMSDKDAASFAHGCDLFEKGIAFAVQATTKPDLSMPAPPEEDEGLAPDYSNVPVVFHR